jgi:proteasome lid subunit RPN8/RPN11
LIFRDYIHDVSLEVEENVVELITRVSLAAYPNEIGGFLIGCYSSDMRRAIVKQILMPDTFVSGPVFFQRDTEGMNHKWEELYANGLIYLGEWHSHPNGTSSYSMMDKQALVNIAEYDRVAIENPVMVIFALSRESIKDVRAYYYRGGNIIEYE